jgi:hypothetical protein
MERMDRIRRVAGAVWMVLGVSLILGWVATGPPDAPSAVTWLVAGTVVAGTALSFRGRSAASRWWGARVAGMAIGFELVGAVGDRFGLLGPPGAPMVSWGDWSHFRVETAELVPWDSLVQPAAVAATLAELTLGALLLTGPWWRWAGKATAGLFTIYLVAMVPGMGATSVLEYALPVLVGGALVASGRGGRPRHERAATEVRHPQIVG